MNIDALANQLYNAIANAQARTADTSADASKLQQKTVDPMLQKGMEILSKMSVGDILTGEIMESDGSRVLLSLGQGAAIEASLKQNVNATEGQLMSFLIKGNDASKISLSPLYTNLASNPTADSALEAAGLPLSEKNQYMVRSMMEEGLPIDKQSLYDMNKAVGMYPDVDPMDLARMQRLNIPLTDEMVTQFEHYQNYEHALTNALSDISEALPESFSQILSEGKPEEAAKFFDDMLKILLPEEEEGAVSKDAQAGTVKDGKDAAIAENMQDKGTDAVSRDGKADPEEVLKNLTENEKAEGKENVSASDQQKEAPAADQRMLSLSRELTRNGFSPELADKVKTGSVTDDALLKDILKELSEKPEWKGDKNLPEKAEVLKDLSGNEGFKELLKNSLSKQWLLKPEEVAEDGKVTKLYEKINNQVKSLTDALTQSGRADTPLFQAANNVSQNINFMNEVNQTFNYVQIPLQMANGEKAGELYVYTNKKSLAEKEGNVSALLHLDMEYLGPMDVHVAMSDYTNVRTQFYLKDESSLDLIAEHIDMLNERLTKRGYNMNAEFINKDEHKSLVDNMTEQSGAVPIYSQTTLDVRA